MTIAAVGTPTLGNDGGASGTTVTASRTGITTGNLLFCYVFWSASGGATSATVSDPTNGAWTLVGTPLLNGAGTVYVSQFYLASTAAVASPLVITATINAATTGKAINVGEISGQNVTAGRTLDTSRQLQTTTAGGINLTALSVKQWPCMYVYMFNHTSGGNYVATDGFTEYGATDTTGGVGDIKYRRFTAAGASSFPNIGTASSATGSTDHQCFGMVFCEAGSSFQVSTRGLIVLNTSNGTVYATKKSVAKIFALSSTGTPIYAGVVGKLGAVVCTATIGLLRSLAHTVALAATGTVVRSRSVSKAFAVACTGAVARVNSIGRIVAAVCTVTAMRMNSIGRIVATACTGAAARSSSVAKAFAVACTGAVVSLRGRLVNVVGVTCTATIGRVRSVGRIVATACTGAITRLSSVAKAFAVACTGLPAMTRGYTRVVATACTAAAARSSSVAKAFAVVCVGTIAVARGYSRLAAAVCTAAITRLSSVAKAFAVACVGAIAITFGGIATYARNAVKAARRIRTIYALAALRVVVGSAPVRLVRALMRRRKVP